MLHYRRIGLLLLFAYLLSIPAFAFGHVPTKGSGELEFFTVNGSNVEVTAHSSKAINDMDKAQAEIALRLKSVATGVIAVCILTSIFFLALSIIKLTKSADNPNERRKAIVGICVSGAVFIGFGGYSVVTGILLNMFV